MERIAIVGCSRRKHSNDELMPAYRRYLGGGIPELVSALGQETFRQSILFLSARYGLIDSDHLIAAYDQILTEDRVDELQPTLRRQAKALLPQDSAVLAVAEPNYLELIQQAVDVQQLTLQLRTQRYGEMVATVSAFVS